MHDQTSVSHWSACLARSVLLPWSRRERGGGGGRRMYVIDNSEIWADGMIGS